MGRRYISLLINIPCLSMCSALGFYLRNTRQIMMGAEEGATAGVMIRLFYYFGYFEGRIVLTIWKRREGAFGGGDIGVFDLFLKGSIQGRRSDIE